MSERIIRRVIIRGHVQGVGYRDWTRYVARERGVEGWVRNRKDGSVEAVFSGAPRCGVGNDRGLPKGTVQCPRRVDRGARRTAGGPGCAASGPALQRHRNAVISP